MNLNNNLGFQESNSLIFQKELEKYRDIKLKFSSYYKYSFNFIGKTDDGEEIFASVGGTADEIYKLNVDVNKEETINSLWPYHIIVSKDGNKIIDWMDDSIY